MKTLFLCLMAAGALYSCKTQQAQTLDQLYIFPVSEYKDSGPPVFPFRAKGGERHLSLIDWGEDALPTSSKSCHHGGEILPPLKGNIGALYDRSNIYFLLSWDDKTNDGKVTLWDERARRWEAGKDDGVSLIFSDNASFNCASFCHMTNWEVENGKFASDYRMFNDKEKSRFVLLRRGKTTNVPILGVIDKDGKKTLEGGQIFQFNSTAGKDKQSTFLLYRLMGEQDDKPLDSSLNGLFILNGKNTFLNGKMTRRINQWQAEIAIPLQKLGYSSLRKGDKIYISLAIFDGTHTNHSITDTFAAEVR